MDISFMAFNEEFACELPATFEIAPVKDFMISLTKSIKQGIVIPWMKALI
jgi:hypothetical protein